MVIKITLGPAADSAEAVVAAQDGEEQGGLTVFGRPSGEHPLRLCPTCGYQSEEKLFCSGRLGARPSPAPAAAPPAPALAVLSPHTSTIDHILPSWRARVPIPCCVALESPTTFTFTSTCTCTTTTASY